MSNESTMQVNARLEAIRRRIEHEHDLINQRLAWLVSSQAFLLTGFAISLNAPRVFAREDYADANRLLIPKQAYFPRLAGSGTRPGIAA